MPQILALLLLAGLSQIGLAQGSAKMIDYDPDICNCPPTSNNDSYIETETVPTGVTFTGNCVNGKCETVWADPYEISEEFQIAEGQCLDGVWLTWSYTGPILINCDPQTECPTHSVLAYNFEWVPWYSSCPQEDDPQDPGVEA